MTEESTLSGVDRLREAAFDLACEQGLASVSSRAIAGRAGGSASAVNYYFGNRDLLIREICAQATVVSERWRCSKVRALADLPPWTDIASGFTARLQSRLANGRGVLALLRELERESRLESHDETRAMLRHEIDAETEYGRDLALELGANAQSAVQWADLALGLTSFLLSERSAGGRSAWITIAVMRLRQRLAREPIVPVEDPSERAEDIARSPAVNDTAARILDAAQAVIAEKGPDRLTQREVAAMAGVSLSSVTYFFGSKQDLVAAAFAEVCASQCRTITNEELSSRGRDEIIEMLSVANHMGEMAAAEALLTAAIHLDSIGPTIDRLRRTRGVGTFILLKQLGLSVDRLDSYLWILICSGRYRRAFGLNGADQSQHMRESALASLKTLFDI